MMNIKNTRFQKQTLSELGMRISTMAPPLQPFAPKAYFDDGILHREILETWRPEHFTDPKQQPSMDGYQRQSGPFKFIVHTARLADLTNQIGIFSCDPNRAIMESDAICASLISHEKPYSFRDFGVILQVPQQNILCAFHRDINTNLTAGLIKKRDQSPCTETEQNIFQQYRKLAPHSRNGMLKDNIVSYSYCLFTPDQIIKNTIEVHNEIVLATRAGVNIHFGLPATRSVNVAGYFMMTERPNDGMARELQTQGYNPLNPSEKMDLFDRYIMPLAKNMGVPALLIDGKATRIID